MKPFVSSVAFEARPADTIVVACSDGRIRRQVGEFLDSQDIEADMYVIPGGPLIFAGGVECYLDSSIALKRIRFLAEQHNARRIILLAHGGPDESAECGMARYLWPRLTSEELTAQQKESLLKASQVVSRETGVPVECYFANAVSGMVQFEKVE